MSATKNIRYRVTCQVHSLKINKNIDFETKIVWKRRINNNRQTRTRLKQLQSNMHMVIQTLIKHLHQSLTQPSILTPCSTNPKMYISILKQTEILAVIEYQGKVKSGGYAKYNISQNLNNNPHGTIITNMHRCFQSLNPTDSMP